MLLDDLCINESEKNKLSSLTNSLPQVLLLVADRGLGIYTVAYSMISRATGHKKHNMLVIGLKPDYSSIIIDQARDIKKFFNLKSIDPTEKRVVLIYQADLMTTEAQNSLLKILEEPPVNCHVVMTSSHPGRLLSTIISRSTVHQVSPPSRAEVSNYLVAKGHAKLEIDKTLALCGPLPGIVTSILNGENSVMVQSIADAKDLLKMPTVDRLKTIDKLTKNKEDVVLRLESLKVISHAALINAADTGKDTTKWANILKGSSTALAQLDVNASPKLVLTNLFLSL